MWFTQHVLPLVHRAICATCGELFDPQAAGMLTRCSKTCGIHKVADHRAIQTGSRRPWVGTDYRLRSNCQKEGYPPMTDHPRKPVSNEVLMSIAQIARELGTAKAALRRLIDDAGCALRDLERDARPGVWNLAETAMQYERAAAKLNAIDELKDIRDTNATDA